MRPEEAAYIRDALADFPAEAISPVLEIGSSTLAFRTIDKPHIDRDVHEPLKRRGVRIVTTDLLADGVEIVGDVFDPQIQSRLKDVKARSLLCCNILEHIEDREAFAAVCDELLSPGGLMVVSVPQSYPYHLDPIDTLYRPQPAEIVALFPGYEIVKSSSIVSSTFLREAGFRAVVMAFIRSLTFRGGLERTKARAHRLLWTWRPYKLSVAILRKPVAA